MLLEDLLAGEAHICQHARSTIIFQGCRLHCLERAHIYVGWHTRGGVIFHTCWLQHLEQAHIYVSWHVRSGVIFHTCRLHRLERAHIYVGWNTKSANNMSAGTLKVQIIYPGQYAICGSGYYLGRHWLVRYM